jgi:hypothetical protein
MARQLNSRNGRVKEKFAYNLRTCALNAAVTFKILSWRSYAFHGTVVPLPASLENRFSGIPLSKLSTFNWMSERSANHCLFTEFFFNFGKSQKSQGLNQANKVGGPFL